MTRRNFLRATAACSVVIDPVATSFVSPITVRRAYGGIPREFCKYITDPLRYAYEMPAIDAALIELQAKQNAALDLQKDSLLTTQHFAVKM